MGHCLVYVFFFKQKTAYEMRISDWSSDVCSSDLLAFAGPVDAGRATMTNAGWDTTAAELRERFGFQQVRLLNDYAALALGLEHLKEADRLRIGPARPAARGACAVLGPGSGLGVAAPIGRASCRERVCPYV